MTSEGHPYAVFRRALDNRNVAVAWAVAAELDHVRLEDALALCLLSAEGQPGRFERAASRWIARYLEEEPRVELEELCITAELLAALMGRHARTAARALAKLFAARGRRDLVDALRTSRQPSDPHGGAAASADARPGGEAAPR